MKAAISKFEVSQLENFKSVIRTETMNCPSRTASPTNFMVPVLDPPVRMRAFVLLAAEIRPFLNVSFFRPSILKFLAPPIREMVRCGRWGLNRPQCSIRKDLTSWIGVLSDRRRYLGK